mmetsp:Transcript_21816/g.37588  ORF Transcript_21816/g.37588 Transcript_21816/m.37588 type:complete len:258 (-) Transcript_21816:415-1188(-)
MDSKLFELPDAEDVSLDLKIVSRAMYEQAHHQRFDSSSSTEGGMSVTSSTSAQDAANTNLIPANHTASIMDVPDPSSSMDASSPPSPSTTNTTNNHNTANTAISATLPPHPSTYQASKTVPATATPSQNQSQSQNQTQNQNSSASAKGENRRLTPRPQDIENMLSEHEDQIKIWNEKKKQERQRNSGLGVGASMKTFLAPPSTKFSIAEAEQQKIPSRKSSKSLDSGLGNGAGVGAGVGASSPEGKKGFMNLFPKKT